LQNKLADEQCWLWYARANTAPLHTLLRKLPSAQQKHFKSVRTDKRKRQYIASRALVCTTLSTLFKKPENYWNIIERPNNSPLILNLPKPYYISLSHSQDFICFALSSHCIGIDVEQSRLRNFSTAAMFMSAQELQKMPRNEPDQQAYFYKLWCAKEAFYKALSKSEQQQRSLTSLSYHALKEGRGDYQLYETSICDYQIAAVSSKPLLSEQNLLHEVSLLP